MSRDLSYHGPGAQKVDASKLALWYHREMRQRVTKSRLKDFMREFARRTRGRGNVYFTGGSTALLLDIREQTIDIDIKIDPEPRGAFEAIAALKTELDLNIELASPDDFIPTPKDWQSLAVPIETVGSVGFYHYDLASQALAKIERGYSQDLADVVSLIQKGYLSQEQLRERFTQIEGSIIRYPAIDANEFRDKVEAFLDTINGGHRDN
jgi:hypothetical protein